MLPVIVPMRHQTLWRFWLIYWWDGRGLMLWLFVRPTGVYLLDFFCSGIQFYLLLSPLFYLLVISILGDDALISEGFFMQTKFYAPWNQFKPSSKLFYWPFQGGTSFVYFLRFFLSCVCYAFLRVFLYVLYGHLLGKGWPLGSRLRNLTASLSLSHWYPGSGVVLDCIDSWSLYPYFVLLPFCYAQIKKNQCTVIP